MSRVAAGGHLLGRSDASVATAVLGRLDTLSALVIWAVAAYMGWRFVTL